MKRIVISSLVVIGLLVTGSLTLFQNRTHAVSASEWQAGNIIDDGVFYNNSDLPLAQDVQNFINSKLTCDTNGTQPATEKGRPDLTHAQYAAMVGWPGPPYVCLRDYYQVPRSDQNINNLGTGTVPNGAISAAQIIKNAADTYGISARVLLVILQKESPGPLLTDSWPLPGQYRNAMGYGCPDTAPCDPTFEGFYNQMMNAARQFKLYKDNAPSYRYKPLQTNTIGWNPNAACGGSDVYINNYATAGLYNYTPYQPNAAALNNLYGSGDGCSAYGNRNFWRIFSDWFGSTRAYDYGWSLSSEEVYLDAAMTKPANLTTLAPNTTYYSRIKALNIGRKTWTNSGSNPVLLATSQPNNRPSSFCNASWVNCGRAAALSEASVAPLSTGTFTFAATTPSTYGTFNERFNLVAEGLSWFNDIGMYLPLTVAPPTPVWQSVSQQIYADSARTTPINTSALAPNTTYYASIKATNIGNTTWSNTGSNPIRLGTSTPVDRKSAFYDSSWLAQNRPATLQETSVAPGDTGTFNFTVKSPSTYGTYTEYFRPVVEGSTWMNDIGFHWPFSVLPPTPQWTVTSQQAYSDSTMTTPYNTSSTTNGTRVYISIKAINTGNTTWANSGSNPVRLGTNTPIDRTSSFYDPSWLSQNRPATLQEASVAPGQTGTFSFWVQAPYKLDTTMIKEYFRPVVEGAAWMNDIGMYQPFTFSSPLTSWQYISQGAYSDAALTTPSDLTQAKLNTKYYLVLHLKNTSGAVWANNGTYPLHLGISNPTTRTSAFYDSSWLAQNRPATLQESTVAPGQTGTFIFTIMTPATATTSNEYFQPVLEGKSWLTDLGLYWSITTK